MPAIVATAVAFIAHLHPALSRTTNRPLVVACADLLRLSVAISGGAGYVQCQ
jgi:hypothetical protein